MSIILLVGALYFFMVTSTRLLLWKKKTLRDNTTPRNEVDEPVEFMPESLPPNVVGIVSKETKAHVSAVIRRAQKTGKWIEAALYLDEKYDGASLQYARKRVRAAFRAEKGESVASPSKKAVNDRRNHSDEGDDDSFE